MNHQFTNSNMRKIPVIWLFVLISCFISTKLHAQGKPGGVADKLQGWWKADFGATPTKWLDASGNNRHAIPVPFTDHAASVPLKSVANFNPAYMISGKTYFYYDKNLRIFNLPGGYDLMTVFGVGLSPQNTMTTFWGEAGGNASPSALVAHSNNKAGWNAPWDYDDYYDRTIFDRNVIYTGWRNLGTTSISQNGLLKKQGTGRTYAGNGTQWYSSPVSQNGDPDQGTYGGAVMAAWGSKSSTGGNISEVIVYKRALSQEEQTQVLSYLGIKYGITLESAVGDYKASDGSTIIFDRTTNTIYTNNIAGIGRDDNSGLMQYQSASNITGQVQLIMGNDENTIEQDNASVTTVGAFGTDMSYLVWGDDGNGMTTITTDIPTLYSGSKRLAREWQAQSLNHASDAVTVQIDLKDIAGISTTDISRIKLMVDTEGDGNFTNTNGGGEVLYYDCTSINGTVVTFNNVVFPDGKSTFTILTSALKGGLTLGNCSTSTLVSSPVSTASVKKFYANNTVQTGYLKVPITTNLAGPISVTISGDPSIKISGTSPFRTTIATGTNPTAFIYIPIKYDGTGTGSVRSIIINTPNSGSTITNLTTATCDAPVTVSLPPSSFTLNCTGAQITPTTFTQNTSTTGTIRVFLTSATAGTDTLKVSSSPVGFGIDPADPNYVSSVPGQSVIITAAQPSIDIPIKFTGAASGSYTITINDVRGQSCTITQNVNVQAGAFTFGDCSAGTVTSVTANGTANQIATLKLPITVQTAGPITVTVNGSGFKVSPNNTTTYTGSVSTTPVQTTLEIPLVYDGSNAVNNTGGGGGTTPIQITSANGTGTCTVTANVNAVAAKVTSVDCTNASSSGNLVASNQSGQKFDVTLPITVSTAGVVHVTVAGAGFSLTDSPYVASVPAGTSNLVIPVRYDGSGTSGTRQIVVTLQEGPTGNNSCNVNVMVNATTGQISFNCPTSVNATPTASNANGNFYTDNTVQTGEVILPISVTKAGTITFIVSGTGVTTSPSPYSAIVNVGDTSVKIPISYNGTGGANLVNSFNISSQDASQGGCLATFTPIVRPGSFAWGNCSNATATATEAPFYFEASGAQGQKGSILIPITNAKAGPIKVTFSSPGFTTNPSPYEFILVDGQTNLNIPFLYDGSGSPGVRAISVSSINSTNNSTAPCTPNVTVTSTNGRIAFGNCSSATSTGYLVANNVPGQGGTVTIPVTASKSGPVTLNLSGDGFVGNSNPYTTNVTAGQTTSITIPFLYDGTGQASFRTLTVSSSNNTNGTICSPVVRVWSTYATYTMQCGASTITATPTFSLGTVGQTGTVTLPISVTTTGSASFYVTGTGFSANPNQFITELKAGQTSVDIPITFDGSGAAGSRTLVISQSPGGSSCSNVTANVVGTPTPTVTTQPNPVVVGQPATFTSTGCAGTIQWYKNNVAIAGATSSTYTTTPAAGDSYTAVCTVNGVPSSPSTPITVPPTAPTVTTQPNPVVAGQPATFTSTGCAGTIQWYKNNVAIAGATSSTYTTSPAAGDSYTAICTVNGVPSSPSTPVTVPPVAPTITVQPNPLVAGQPATFTSTGCAGTIQWYKNGNPISGATSSTYSTSAAVAAGDSYTAVCTVNGVSSGQSTAVTVPASVAAPTVTVQPNPLVAGQPATFTSTGCAGTIQWYKNGNPIAGATSSTYSTSAVAAGDSYTAVCTVNGVQSSQSTAVTVPAGNVDLTVFFSNVTQGTLFTVGSSTATKTYTLTVRNKGTVASTPATLSIPDFTSGFTTTGFGSFAIPALAPGGSTTFSITLTVTNAGSSSTITASIPNGSGGDTVSSNNITVLTIASTNP
ncbi:hypothetical protein [Emticicia sp. W12TSBA100-4]|uniref:beta strand repeat-containing protein n=1 Tax=Emticicia sp. W12TSBA100-4 TaxID=3160965 RepID=UPI003306914C